MDGHPPGYYADTLSCPECGEDIHFDGRRPEAMHCLHCEWPPMPIPSAQ